MIRRYKYKTQHTTIEEIQNVMRNIIQKTGMAVSTHPPNIFHGKVPGQALEKYLNLHRRQDTIKPC